MKNLFFRTGRYLRLACAVGLVACSSATNEPAQSPDDVPPLDDEPAGEGSGAAAPSSAKVKEGMDAIAAGDFETAKEALSAAVAENPEDPQAAFYLGVAEESLGDTASAIASYERALELDPKLVEARINLSGALLDSGDAVRALEAAEAGIREQPKSGALLLNRAAALDALERSEEALKAYAAAVAAAPDNARTHLLYAEALARSGDEAKAKAELQKAASSDEIDVLASAGRLFGRLKAFDACIETLTRAIDKEKAAELLVHRGICRHGKKDDKGAKADYDAAIAADQNFAPGYFYLGQHLKAAGDKKGAKQALQKAAELDPSGGVGSAAKKALKGL